MQHAVPHTFAEAQPAELAEWGHVHNEGEEVYAENYHPWQQQAAAMDLLILSKGAVTPLQPCCFIASLVVWDVQFALLTSKLVFATPRRL